ncbi:hypothetical protein ACOMHN_035333 [Nucella lapillus]
MFTPHQSTLFFADPVAIWFRSRSFSDPSIPSSLRTVKEEDPRTCQHAACKGPDAATRVSDFPCVCWLID